MWYTLVREEVVLKTVGENRRNEIITTDSEATALLHWCLDSYYLARNLAGN